MLQRLILPATSPALAPRWVRLHTVRTALTGLAFGSTLCGVLLLSKKAKA